MTFDTLARRDVKTSLGVVPLWSRPDVVGSRRPLLLAIPGLFTGPDELSRLPDVMQGVADTAIVRLPGAEAPLLADRSLPAFSRAVGELIDQLFADRPVILMGVSIGATAALGVRSRHVRRIVAAEPILATEALWPLVQPLRGLLRKQPRKGPLHDLYWRLFGVAFDRRAPRDYRQVLEGLAVPTDVLLAGQPLEPERSISGFPSLVAAAERARLAAMPHVRLHLAPDAGHNIAAAASKQLTELAAEACRRGAADPAFDVRGLDEALLEAVPLMAQRAAHWGPGGLAFAGAYLSWNPTAAVSLLGEAEETEIDPADITDLDALVLGAPPPPALLARLVGGLRPGGHLVARWGPAQGQPAELGEALADIGLTLGAPVDAGGSGVLRARKGPAARPLRLEIAAFASRLMDVRTRLPARGLRSDPELLVDYLIPPHTPAPQPYDAPKVLVMQRQGMQPLEVFHRQMAYAIARGWLLVVEYDDHPGLVAEALERPYTREDLDRFGYAHAVQTTTEPLAAVFRAVNPEVRIFENTAFELAPFPRTEAPRRVFYGAISRGDFGVEVARSLAPVVEAFPDVEFVVLGDPTVFDALPTANKVYEDYLAYEAYLARMAGCAVSLSPIEPLPMRETKSDAKFLDAARAGVVTIGSPLIYGQTIQHGVNGLLAPRLEDWAPLLRQALADPAATRAMGRRAWDYVRTERMFATQVAQRRDWYRDLWARREALDQAALARIPGLAEAVAAERAQLNA